MKQPILVSFGVVVAVAVICLMMGPVSGFKNLNLEREDNLCGCGYTIGRTGIPGVCLGRDRDCNQNGVCQYAIGFDYTRRDWREDGRCGDQYPAPNGEGAICAGLQVFCNGNKCQHKYANCNDNGEAVLVNNSTAATGGGGVAGLSLSSSTGAGGAGGAGVASAIIPVQGFVDCVAKITGENIVEVALPWHAARQECRRRGGDLATPCYPADFINHIRDNYHKNALFWVGASDTESPDTFKWTTGASVDGPWYPGHPQVGRSGYQCLGIQYSDERQSGIISGFDCTSSRWYICSIKI